MYDSSHESDDTAALMIVALKGVSLPSVAGFQPHRTDQIIRQLERLLGFRLEQNWEQLMTTAQTAAGRQQRRSGFRLATRLFNPLAMLLAGTRIFPLYGVLEHRGRRSGKLFRTPVVVRPTVDGFVVPMPWGEGTDWYRNVKAAATSPWRRSALSSAANVIHQSLDGQTSLKRGAMSSN